jgi:Carboxypeptidase regulatory-like domain
MFRSFSTKKHLKFVKNSVAFVALAASVLAQTDRGSIRGTITDQTGAVVPGVSVTVSNSATGVSNSVRSNDTGVYGIAALPAGAPIASKSRRVSRQSLPFLRRGWCGDM